MVFFRDGERAAPRYRLRKYLPKRVPYLFQLLHDSHPGYKSISPNSLLGISLRTIGWKHRLETFTECFQQELFIFETFNDQLYQKNDIVPAIITLSWRIYRILLLSRIILRYLQQRISKILFTLHGIGHFFQFKILRKPEGMFNVN